MSEVMFQNPILPGFYPDPSICRVGEDYWLVCSTFACFPGVPIFHSRDLVHWQQIGHVLDRPSQLDLDGLGHSSGIFAPTLRHHQGVFYMITTLVANQRPDRPRGNFIVTATDPAGPWSDPVWLKDAPGIDPSLFFDDDGSMWYCGTRERAEPAFSGDWEIWVRRLDPASLEFTGEATAIWRGALRDCIWPEGPHIYKKDGWYYLLHAEAGTGEHHAVSIARSKSITNGWSGNPGNPVLTHRHLGKSCDITNVGHGDLVQTQAGEWWMVVLASRPHFGYRNLGRETFLVPLQWEDGWPVFCRSQGRISHQDIAPKLPLWPLPPQPACEHFDAAQAGMAWITLRTPREPFFSLSARPGFLRLQLRPVSLVKQEQASFLGRRQLHQDWQARTILDFQPAHLEAAAGLALIQSNQWHYRMEKGLGRAGDEIRLIKVAAGTEEVLATHTVMPGPVILSAWAKDQRLHFAFESPGQPSVILAANVDASILSTDIAGGFVGSLIGIFAAGPGGFADFDWFEYQGI